MEWGELIGKAMATYRGSIGSLYLLSLLTTSASFAVNVGFQVTNGTTSRAFMSGDLSKVLAAAATSLVAMMLTFVMQLLIMAFQEGALTLAASWIVLGERPSLAEMARGTFYRMPSLFLASLVWWVIFVPALLACCLPGIVPATLFSLVIPGIVLEDLGPIATFRRSWNLITVSTVTNQKPLLHAFLVLLIAFAIVMGVSIVAGAPGAIAGMAWGMAHQNPSNPFAVPTPPAWLYVLPGIWQVPVMALTLPFSAIVRVLLFYDLKLKQEGDDVEGAPVAAV